MSSGVSLLVSLCWMGLLAVPASVRFLTTVRRGSRSGFQSRARSHARPGSRPLSQCSCFVGRLSPFTSVLLQRIMRHHALAGLFRMVVPFERWPGCPGALVDWVLCMPNVFLPVIRCYQVGLGALRVCRRLSCKVSASVSAFVVWMGFEYSLRCKPSGKSHSLTDCRTARVALSLTNWLIPICLVRCTAVVCLGHRAFHPWLRVRRLAPYPPHSCHGYDSAFHSLASSSRRSKTE